MRLRRQGRFGELVRRQLELFELDEAELLRECATAEEAWNRAAREDAEEAYGDYQLAVDALAERLLDLRERYASTLPGDVAADYGVAFGAAARKRFRRHPGALGLLDET